MPCHCNMIRMFQGTRKKNEETASLLLNIICHVFITIAITNERSESTTETHKTMANESDKRGKKRTQFVLVLLTRMMDINLVIVFIACTVAWAGFIFRVFTFNLYQTHSQTIFAIDYIMWCGCCSWDWCHGFFFCVLVFGLCLFVYFYQQ